MSNCVVRPPMPYRGAIPGGVHEGKLIQIRGNVSYGCDVFDINLLTGLDTYSDRALHISVRFNSREVVRNALIRNDWGCEERHGPPFPFSTGRDFNISILAQNFGYKIAVDNRHCWEFAHRIPLTRVNTVFINGGVQIERIEYLESGTPAIQTPGTCVPIPGQFPIPGQYPLPGQGLDPSFVIPPPGQGIGTCVIPPSPSFPTTTTVAPSSNLAPVYNPPIPYAYPIYGGIRPGMMIYISGRPTASSYKFTINLQAGTAPYPPPDIGFHFDARFFNRTIVRNTRENDNWGPEELSIPFFPFNYGVNFDMIIRVESDKYMVALNGQHFVEFHHRMWPLSRLDTLYIENDIVVSSIRFA